jgi:hypothetical protein
MPSSRFNWMAVSKTILCSFFSVLAHVEFQKKNHLSNNEGTKHNNFCFLFFFSVHSFLDPSNWNSLEFHSSEMCFSYWYSNFFSYFYFSYFHLFAAFSRPIWFTFLFSVATQKALKNISGVPLTLSHIRSHAFYFELIVF